MSIPDGDLLITPQQISDELQGMVTPHTVTSWCRSGKLKATRAGRKWIIRRADFVAFLRTNEGGGERGKANALAA
jgi:excisionase family DNA binding protein